MLPNSYAHLPPQMFHAEGPVPVADPQPIALNEELAAQLDLDLGDTWVETLSGNALPEGLTPITAAYAGHQFGHWNPKLGDGRAVLLGESTINGTVHDIQLKGTGRTHWSRSGDGRAWVGPVIREYIISEAMHALDVPTTRALAAVTTGEQILRDQGPLPGAIITRVAQSHLRVGSFQYFAARGDNEALRALFQYAQARHYPNAKTPTELLTAAVDAQVDLIAKWMGLGFIHGVMNTDNSHVGGLTIDYGPCAFMDSFHPMMVYSSIDRNGRYAYGNQPNIANWNMAQFATSLLPLCDDRDAAVATFTEVIESFATKFEAAYRHVFAAKLGIDPTTENADDVIHNFLKMLEDNGADFTNSFRALADGSLPSLQGFDVWKASWLALRDDTDLNQVNPAVIPRNHLVEAAIVDATAGNYDTFHALNTALATPFQTPPDPKFTTPPLPDEIVAHTFCGT